LHLSSIAAIDPVASTLALVSTRLPWFELSGRRSA
jgi:hypothetical protein